ncbi:hypothetical protein LTR08_008142 [Meristemomyces frigidus]|nr:hypothetical protein LTR08_008142 [Meristemomyces frigidus]
MRFSNVLPFAAVSTALVLPPQETFNSIAVEDNHRGDSFYDEAPKEKDGVLSSIKKHYEEVEQTSKSVWDTVYKSSKSVLDSAFETAEDAQDGMASWMHTEADDFYDGFEDHDHPPHHGPPHHGPPHDGPPHDGPPHDGPPHHGPSRPVHPPHHGKPNQTVYQLISESKYTEKLSKLINKYPDLVETLNSTNANYTVFAPTDKAFEKIPKHAPEPDEMQLKQLLSYHIVDGFYPAGRVLLSHTAPTLLKVDHLSNKQEQQRVAFKIGLNGLTVNFYSRIIAVNIFGTNGVIHGVNSILIPPPSVISIVDLLPGEFSTLELGLSKTGLLETLNNTDHDGGTLFAPSNFAFQKLGPKINAFLFSTYGVKYLKALLQYHVVHGNTLYSDAYYSSDSSKDDHHGPPTKGIFHVDLPTLLKDRKLSVDILRYGRYINMKINAFSRVTVQDGIAEDGVIHAVSDVIIPPKDIGRQGGNEAELQYWTGEEMMVEELKERLAPLMDKSDL